MENLIVYFSFSIRNKQRKHFKQQKYCDERNPHLYENTSVQHLRAEKYKRHHKFGKKIRKKKVSNVNGIEQQHKGPGGEKE